MADLQTEKLAEHGTFFAERDVFSPNVDIPNAFVIILRKDERGMKACERLHGGIF